MLAAAGALVRAAAYAAPEWRQRWRRVASAAAATAVAAAVVSVRDTPPTPRFAIAGSGGPPRPPNCRHRYLTLGFQRHVRRAAGGAFQ